MSLLSRKKISAYFISLLLILVLPDTAAQETEKDTVDYQLYARGGIDLVGPGIYLADPDIMNTEMYFSFDLNDRYALYSGFGYSRYSWSQYNYRYNSTGLTFKAGIDINIMRPQNSGGRYWAGIGIRYCVSPFRWEVPVFEHTNYWGNTSSMIPEDHSWGHFIELAPGFRAEVFKNFTMGWSIPLRRLIYSGTGKDLRPVYMPGFGNASSNVSAGIMYHLSWNIPTRLIKVKARVSEIIEPEPGTNPVETTQPAQRQTIQPGRTGIAR